MGCFGCSWLNCTNLGHVVVAAVIIHTFWTLYSLVSPDMPYTADNGEPIPTLSPVWPLGAPITVEIALAKPGSKHAYAHQALLVLQKSMPFSAEAADIEEHVHICGDEGLRQGLCSLDTIGGITVEGNRANRTLTKPPSPHAVSMAGAVASALQRGEMVVAHVTIRLDGAEANRLMIPEPQRVIFARQGAVALVKKQAHKPRPRRAYLLTNQSSKEQGWENEINAALPGAWQPAAGTSAAHFVTSLDVQIACDSRPIPVTAPPQIVQSLQHVPRQYKVRDQRAEMSPPDCHL
jgi:hypothetical protein